MFHSIYLINSKIEYIKQKMEDNADEEMRHATSLLQIYNQT